MLDVAAKPARVSASPARTEGNVGCFPSPATYLPSDPMITALFPATVAFRDAPDPCVANLPVAEATLAQPVKRAHAHLAPTLRSTPSDGQFALGLLLGVVPIAQRGFHQDSQRPHFTSGKRRIGERRGNARRIPPLTLSSRRPSPNKSLLGATPIAFHLNSRRFS